MAYSPEVGINRYARSKYGAIKDNKLAAHMIIRVLLEFGTLPILTTAAFSISSVAITAKGNTVKGLVVTQCQDEFAYTAIGRNAKRIPANTAVFIIL
jgi:hypothetical protein